ncbi:hypothetical protein GGR57DRAFT_322203 [Xylariaceae sp. FL1272]|nr:hypothetical protein GGR57DRAFT_322203 [Xylariaceae sp. FL1272]
MKRKLNTLENENARYRELLAAIYDRSDADAEEIFRRLRIAPHPLAVLESIKQADLLLVNPSTIEWATNKRLLTLDNNALQYSAIKVRAQPWTAIAGNGIVSELITNFFAWDNAYLFPAIDQRAFVDDMNAGVVEKGVWCTPLLVNAICAQRSQSVESSKVFGAITHQNMVERFLSESKSLLDREQGRASIPTVLALVLLFLTTTETGRDRAATMYRSAAYEMLKRLKLEARFQRLSTGPMANSAELARISRALWGIFLLETRIAYLYYQPSSVPPPTMPQMFYGNQHAMFDTQGNVDVVGNAFSPSSYQVPLVPGILAAVGNLSVLFYEIMQYLTAHEKCKGSCKGSPSDLRVRKGYYVRLRQFRAQLPRRFLVEENFTPSTCFLRMHESEIAFSLLQGLPPEQLFRTDFDPAESFTVRDVCLRHCRSDTELIESYIRQWPIDSLVTRQLYMSMQPLVLLLEEPEAKDLFTRDCFMARLSAHNLKVGGFFLQATQAFAWAMKKDIPEAARPYLEGWTQDVVKKDLPVSFAIPQQDEIRQLLEDGGGDENAYIGAQLGALIEKWALV